MLLYLFLEKDLTDTFLLKKMSSIGKLFVGKEGPIYNVQWSPKNHEFCVVYGFMPAKATIFNLKCEPAFELGTGAINSIYYNPHGNILLLGGFGNLRGQIALWDAVGRKKIGKSVQECCLLLFLFKY